MNSVRKRLIAYWALLAGWAVLLALHHPVVSWGIVLLINPLVRDGLPRPTLSIGTKVFILCGITVFLAFAIAHGYHALPPAVLTVGNLTVAASCVLGFASLAWFDYGTYRKATLHQDQSQEYPAAGTANGSKIRR